jgi:pyridoxamine 5'-phosphate oxidase family protein
MMSTFTDAEITYLSSQPLGRIATVGADGRPHVTPVGVFYDPETQSVVVASAGDMPACKKFRDAQRQTDVAPVRVHGSGARSDPVRPHPTRREPRS